MLKLGAWESLEKESHPVKGFMWELINMWKLFWLLAPRSGERRGKLQIAAPIKRGE